MRLFVAVDVPDTWRAIARAATEAIARTSDVPLRRVDPALMHLTLRFLGEVDEERVPALDAALAHRVPPVDVALELGGAGTFGPPPRTQVVWLGVRGDIDGMRVLARRVDLAVADAGIELEPGRFAPHLTLARLPRTVDAEGRRLVAEVARAMPPPDPLPFRAREVILVRSQLGGAQPVYRIVGRYS